MSATKDVNNVKVAVQALTEQAQDTKSTAQSLKSVQQQAVATHKLSREGNKSRLMEIGAALVVFPEPTPVTSIAGACILAAGTVQKGIQNQNLYLEDITKNLKSSIKEITRTKSDLKI
jgi:CTP-dependent riboflavin kinase